MADKILVYDMLSPYLLVPEQYEAFEYNMKDILSKMCGISRQKVRGYDIGSFSAWSESREKIASQKNSFKSTEQAGVFAQKEIDLWRKEWGDLEKYLLPDSIFRFLNSGSPKFRTTPKGFKCSRIS